MKIFYKTLLTCIFLVALSNAYAQVDTMQNNLFRFNTPDLLALPPDLLDIQVTTASKNAESLRDVAACVSVITAYEIEAYGAINLSDALDRVVGTYITGSYYMTNNIVSIRGDVTNNYNTHVLILLNGRPFRENMYSGFNVVAYSSIPINSIDRIEVVRGPGSVLYGTSAFSGVVNIILKEGKKQRMEGSQTIGGDGTSVSELGMGFEKNKLKIAANFRTYQSDGWDFIAFDEDSTKINEKSFERGLGANVRLKYGNITMNNFWGINRRSAFAESPFESFNPVRQNESTRIFNDIGYNRSFSDKWQMSLNLTHNYFIEIEDKPNQTLNTNHRDIEHYVESQDILLEMTHYLKPSPKMNIILGGLVNDLNGVYKQNEVSADGRRYDYKSGSFNPNPRLAIPRYNVYGYAAYFQGDYAFKKFKFIAGVQYNNTNEQEVFVPRLGIIYNTNQYLNFKLLYGEAFRVGSVFERRSTEEEAYGNARLKPETIATIDFQATYNRKDFYSAVTLYTSYTSDLIILSDRDDSLYVDPVTLESYNVYVNNPRYNYYGLEIETRYNINKHFILNNYITLQNVTGESASEDGHHGGDKLQQVTGIPQFMLNTGITWRSIKKGLSVGVFNSFYGKVSPLNKHSIDGREQDEQKNYNPPSKAYSSLSVNLSINLKTFFNIDNIPNTTLSIYGQNLLNQKVYHADYNRSEVNSVPGRGGRTIYGKLTVKF